MSSMICNKSIYSGIGREEERKEEREDDKELHICRNAVLSICSIFLSGIYALAIQKYILLMYHFGIQFAHIVPYCMEYGTIYILPTPWGGRPRNSA